MADSSLTAIRLKIRRITRSPSTAQITDAEIDEYVNTFIQYDFPEHLRLFNLRETHTFYTDPNIDTYASNTIPGDPLQDFEQRFLTIHDPIYIAGYQVQFSQSRNEFFRWWPFNNNIATVATGDGVTTAFGGTLTGIPILRNNVTFSAQDAAGNGLRLSDDGNGNLVGDIGVGPNTINYITGVFALDFSAPPAANTNIDAEYVPYQASRPTSVLFFDGQFIVRPVPDRVYPVQFEVYRRPSELLAAGTSPELQEWWQFIAYGACRLIFEDRSDYDSIAKLDPRFKEAQRLILRRTIVQQTNERTATIYTDSLNQGVGPSYNWGQGSF